MTRPRKRADSLADEQVSTKAPDPAKLRFSVEAAVTDRPSDPDTAGDNGSGDGDAVADLAWDEAVGSIDGIDVTDRAGEVAGPVPGADFWPERRFSTERFTKLVRTAASVPTASDSATSRSATSRSATSVPITAKTPAVRAAGPRPPSILEELAPEAPASSKRWAQSLFGSASNARRVKQGSLAVVASAAVLVAGSMLLPDSPAESNVEAGASGSPAVAPAESGFDDLSLRAPAAGGATTVPAGAGGVSGAPSNLDDEGSDADDDAGVDGTVAANPTVTTTNEADSPSSSEEPSTAPSAPSTSSTTAGSSVTSTTAGTVVTTASGGSASTAASTTPSTAPTTTADPTTPTTRRTTTTAKPTTSTTQATTSTTANPTTSSSEDETTTSDTQSSTTGEELTTTIDDDPTTTTDDPTTTSDDQTTTTDDPTTTTSGSTTTPGGGSNPIIT